MRHGGELGRSPAAGPHTGWVDDPPAGSLGHVAFFSARVT